METIQGLGENTMISEELSAALEHIDDIQAENTRLREMLEDAMAYIAEDAKRPGPGFDLAN